MLDEIVRYVLGLFKEKKNVTVFLAATIIFLLLFFFFFGIAVLPTPFGTIGFYKMEPPSAFEYFYIYFSTIVSALIMMITVAGARERKKAANAGVSTEQRTGKGKASYALGLSVSILGAVCPACLGINFLLFGNVLTAQLSFLIPYVFWIQIAGIIFLLLALYFVAKSAFENRCISCEIPAADDEKNKTSVSNFASANLISVGIMALALLFLLLQVFYFYSSLATAQSAEDDKAGVGTIVANGQIINIDEVIEEVTPKDGFVFDVRWNGIVSKMIKEGVLDPRKLEEILTKRYNQEMKPEWREILAGKDAPLTINKDNAVFMMYLLWVFAKHNENQILFDSPFAKYFTNYDIGVGRAGYGDVKLLVLTPQQQRVAKEVAENAYRPCCGNSTARPDCSHGYSALGLVELMASQGFSKEEIFDAFVKFNSYWFPETYIKNALYFRITEGKRWEEVNKEMIAGAEYSSLRGSYKVKKYLKDNFRI